VGSLYGDTVDARRDVRAYVVTMAPEVAGRIVELPVEDNKYVHTGDLLTVIDPINYTIAVSQAEAAVAAGAGERAERRCSNKCAAGAVSANAAQLDLAKAALVFAQQQAARYQTLSQKAQAL